MTNCIVFPECETSPTIIMDSFFIENFLSYKTELFSILTIVLRRSDDQDNPIVKIEFSNESKEFLQGQELSVAKEMIRAGIESVSGNVSDFDEFFDSQKERLSKKTVILH